MDTCDNLTELLPALGSSTDEAVQRVFRNVLTSQNSVCASLLEKGIANRATNILDNRKKLPEVVLSAKLTPEEESGLQSVFPEFHLKFSHSASHTHAYAYSSRILETAQLLSEHGYHPGIQPAKGYNDVICDFGGNYYNHTSKSRAHVHSCSPLLDWYDSSRDLRRELQLGALRNKDIPNDQQLLIEAALDQDQEKVRCYNKAQDCGRKAMRAIMIHSSYDMSLKDIANAMAKKDTLLLLGTFIYVPEIMTSTYSEGHIPILNSYYSIDRTTGTIHFSFENDPSFNYVHRLDSYLGIALNSLIKSSCGKVYSIELGTNRNGIQFYSITRCLRPPLYLSPLVHTSWLPSLKGKTIVGYFTWDMALAKNDDTLKPLKRISIIAPTPLVDSILTYALKSDEKTFNMKDLFSFATSVNTRQICNGKDVTSPERLRPMDLYYVAHAIYIYAYSEKWKGGVADKKLMEMERHRRDFAKAGLLKKFFSSLFCDRSFLMKFLSVSDWDCFDKVHTWLYHWRTAPEEYGIRIQDATWFSTHETVIKSYKTNRDHISEIREAIAEGNLTFVDDDRNTLLNCIKTETTKVIADILDEAAAPPDGLETVCDNLGFSDDQSIKAIRSHPYVERGSRPASVVSRGSSQDLPSTVSSRCTDYIDASTNSASAGFVSCSKSDDLVPIKTLGDGNCFLYSVHAAYSIPAITIQKVKEDMYKKYLDNNHEALTFDPSNEILKFLNNDNIPASDPILDLYAATYKIRICVHYSHVDLCTRFGPKSDSVVHILFHRPVAGDVGHFEGMRLMEKHESILTLPSKLDSLNETAKRQRNFFENADPERKDAYHPLAQALDKNVDSDFYLGAELLDHTPPNSTVLLMNFKNSYFSAVLLSRGLMNVFVIPHDDFPRSDSNAREGLVCDRLDPPSVDVVYLDVREQSMTSDGALTKKCFKNALQNVCYSQRTHPSLIILTDMSHVRENVDTYIKLFTDFRESNLITSAAEHPCSRVIIIRFDNLSTDSERDPMNGYSRMREMLSSYHDRLCRDLKDFSTFTGETEGPRPVFPRWMLQARAAYDYLNSPSDVISTSSMSMSPTLGLISYRSTASTSEDLMKFDDDVEENTPQDTHLEPALERPLEYHIQGKEMRKSPPIALTSLYDTFINLSRVLIRDIKNLNIMCDIEDIAEYSGASSWLSTPFHSITVSLLDSSLPTYESVRTLFSRYPIVYLTTLNASRFHNFLSATGEIGSVSSTRPIHYMLLIRSDNPLINLAITSSLPGRKGLTVQPVEIDGVLHHLLNFSQLLETDTVTTVSNDAAFSISPGSIRLQWSFGPSMFLESAATRPKTLVSLSYNNLLNVLDSLNSSEKTVLCHCASANLKDPKRMSRGVAKQVVKAYGLPTVEHLSKKYSNILVQEISEKFTVLTLLTKAEFNSKPARDNFRAYFKSISQLFAYCRDEGVQRLITVPLGMGLDKVPVSKFLRGLGSDARPRDPIFRVEIVTNDFDIFSTLRNVLPDTLGDMSLVDAASNSTTHVQVKKDMFSKPIPSRAPTPVVPVEKTHIQDSWNNSETVRNEWACFRPEVDLSATPKAYFANAIQEQLELWRVHDATLQKSYRSLYQALVVSIGVSKNDNAILRDKRDFGLVDSKTGRFVIRPKHDRIYTHAFDGEKFVPVEEDKKYSRSDNSKKAPPLIKSRQTTAVYLMVSRDTELMNDIILYDKCKSVDLKNFSIPKFRFIQGVPGCGKTHYIVHNHTIGDSVTENDLVLTTTKEGAIDLLKRVQEINPAASKNNYSTSHSYLMNRRTRAKTVWIDEALMKHAGEIFLVAYYSQCTTMHLLGDTAQIPYINRIAHAYTRFSDPTIIIKDITYLSHSYRCPGDVAAVLGKKYKQGMTSESALLGTTSLVTIRNIKDVNFVKNRQYLVFKQEEKETMLRAGFPTSTIHEYQGKQTDHVVVVRLSRYERENIYTSEPHALVALSRHRKSLVYYTYWDTDALSTLIKRCREVIHAPKALKHKAGGCGSTVTLMKKGFFDLSVTDALRKDRETPFLRLPARTYDALYLSPPTVNPFPMRAGVVGEILHVNCVQSDEKPVVPLSYNDHEGFYSEEEKLLLAPPVVRHPACGSVVDLQTWYDAMLPGCSIHYMEHDQQIVEDSDRELTLDRVSFDTIAHKNSKAPRPALSPILRTAMYNNRVPSQLETLLAMIKRNFNVPDLNGVVDNDMISDLMVERFVKTFIPIENEDVFMAMKTKTIDINSSSIQSWLRTQSTAAVGQIKPVDAYWNTNLNTYHFMNKKSVKPALEINAPYSYPALQTIAFHDKNVNAVFCPVFRDLKERLLSVLDKRFLLFCDVSPDDFVRLLNERFDPACLDHSEKLEIDISKYDKSQGELMYMFENKIYRMLGMSSELNSAWMDAHKETRLKDYAHRVTAFVDYQRKSGDASTYFGNTVVLMGIISTLYDITGCTMGLFSGDDSLLVGGDIHDDRNFMCANVFNLESKMFKYRDSYFCSKFLINVNGYFRLIPDPLKVVTKLGRRDLVDYTHANEYRISYCDLLKDYEDISITPVLNRAINERYPNNILDHSFVLSSIHNIINDRENFNDLFYIAEGVVLIDDPSRPKLE